MQFEKPFDARAVEPAAGFPPPPVLADYHVVIVDSEGKPTSTGGGQLTFMLEIKDPGIYLNRKVPWNLQLFNANPQTVEIAYKQLSAVCWVTGQFNVQDTRQLHNIPFIATIGPQKKDERYAEVFQVKDNNGQVPGKAAAPSVPGATPPATPSTTPSWAPAPTVPQAPVAPAFPPEGWTAHPTAPGYYYKGQEVLSEAQLRAYAIPAPPVVPPAPAPAPAPLATWQPPTAAAPAASAAPGAAPWAPGGTQPTGKPPWER